MKLTAEQQEALLNKFIFPKSVKKLEYKLDFVSTKAIVTYSLN